MMNWVPTKIKHKTVSRLLDMFHRLGMEFQKKENLPVGNYGLAINFVAKYDNLQKQQKAREKRLREVEL